MPTSLLRAGPLAADFVSGVDRPTFAVRNGHRLAVFPDTGTTRTFFTLNMPTVFAQGDIDVKLHWMAAIATGGDCVWEVAFERHQVGTDNLDGDSFGAPIVFVQAAPGTAGIVQEAIIPVSAAQYDGILQGEQFRLRVSRLGDDTSDIMSGDAQLMTVVVEQDAAPAGGGGGGFWTDGTGTRSAIGKGSPAPTALGLEALSHGTSATADGASATAFGNAASADGDNSVAFGTNARADANDSFAFGTNANAPGVSCIAIGNESRAGDGSPVIDNSIAIGKNSNTRGHSSVAIGYYAHSGEDNNARFDTVAIGSYSRASRANAIAIGHNARAEKDDCIAIGRDAYIYNSYRAVVIGTACSSGVSPYGGHENVVIGWSNNAVYASNILIGTHRTGGDQEILIGHGSSSHSAADRNNCRYNIVINSDPDNYQGSSNPQGAFTASNVVIVAGGNRGGLRPYPVIAQYENVLVSSGASYIYGRCTKNIVIGMQQDLGDYQNVASQVYKNTFIGYRGRIASFNGNPPNETKYNVLLGYANYVWNNVTASVIIGAGSGCYYQSSVYENKNISIGNYCYNYSGHGNVSMGAYCKIKDATYVNPGGNASQWSRGNFAIGYQCEIVKIGTGAFRSTMAQGCGVEIGVSGQRAFSDDQQVQNVVAGSNQGSFIIPKTETIDATQTTLLTFPTLPDKAYGLWGWLIARRTDVDGFNATFSLSNTLAYRNAAGAPVLVGDPKAWVMDSNQGAPGWSIDIHINVNDIVVRVTGTAAQTIEWLGWIQVIEVRG